jgi:hypothetical protein
MLLGTTIRVARDKSGEERLGSISELFTSIVVGLATSDVEEGEEEDDKPNSSIIDPEKERNSSSLDRKTCQQYRLDGI